MGYGLHRDHLQHLSKAKLDDAISLLEAGRPSNAYYLAGYAIEFALKARIARQMEANVIPDKSFITKVFSHDLTELVRLAGLERKRVDAEKNDPQFAARWGVVKDWSEQSRYEEMQLADAQYLVEAISNPNHGVLQWIEKHW